MSGKERFKEKRRWDKEAKKGNNISQGKWKWGEARRGNKREGNNKGGGEARGNMEQREEVPLSPDEQCQFNICVSCDWQLYSSSPAGQTQTSDLRQSCKSGGVIWPQRTKQRGLDLGDKLVCETDATIIPPVISFLCCDHTIVAIFRWFLGHFFFYSSWSVLYWETKTGWHHV